jgi:hypothetical protein
MRIVLSAALMIVATIALADEPSAPQTNAEATAPTEQTNSAATAEKSATPAASTESTTAAVAQEEDGRPFKPPTGYRPKRVNGNEVYCTKVVVLGSRFPKEDCRTEAQLKDLEAQRASMRNEMNQKSHECTSAVGCANP